MFEFLMGFSSTMQLLMSEVARDELIESLIGDQVITPAELTVVFDYLSHLASTIQVFVIHKRLREGGDKPGDVIWRKISKDSEL